MYDKKQEKISASEILSTEIDLRREIDRQSSKLLSILLYIFLLPSAVPRTSVTKQPTESHWHRRFPGDFNCSLPKWLSFRRSCQSSFHNQFLNVARWTPKMPASRYVGEIIKWLRRVSKGDSVGVHARKVGEVLFDIYWQLFMSALVVGRSFISTYFDKSALKMWI